MDFSQLYYIFVLYYTLLLMNVSEIKFNTWYRMSKTIGNYIRITSYNPLLEQATTELLYTDMKAPWFVIFHRFQMSKAMLRWHDFQNLTQRQNDVVHEIYTRLCHFEKRLKTINESLTDFTFYRMKEFNRVNGFIHGKYFLKYMPLIKELQL